MSFDILKDGEDGEDTDLDKNKISFIKKYFWIFICLGIIIIVGAFIGIFLRIKKNKLEK